MIRSFADRETERLWLGDVTRRIPSTIQDRALVKLRLLNAASRIEDLRVPPGNQLEQLRGSRKGQWSIRINQQWRICFAWHDGGADQVEITDYH